MELSDEKVKEIEGKVRELINWIAVFEEEYNVPKEVVDKLRSGLEEIASEFA